MSPESKPDSETVAMKLSMSYDNNTPTRQELGSETTENRFEPSNGTEKKSCEILMEKKILNFENNTFKKCSSKIWRKKKFDINLSLFAFRLSQFLWYGAGSIPSVFLGIFLKNRGLTIVELSSVISVVFIFQLLSSFVTGITADRIGNAKPVLLFLMLSTSCVLVLMLLTPNINGISCIHLKKQVNHSSTSLNSSCYKDCLLDRKNHEADSEKFTEISMFENGTVELEANNDTDTCISSLIVLTNGSFSLSEESCCNRCKNSTTDSCTKVRKEYLVPVYGFLILALYSLWTTAYRFMNFVSTSLADKNDSHFGKEMAIAECGNLSVMILVAFVLNIDKSTGSGINFDPLIGIAAGIKFCAFLILCMTSVPILPPGKSLLKKALSLVRDADILALILLFFIAGNGYAFNYTFHMVFLETINAPSLVVSLHSVAIVLYAFPLLLTSEWWLKRFGAERIFVLGLLALTVNDFFLSYIHNYWLSLILDVTVAFSNNLFWVAVVTHCQKVAPLGFGATLNALAGTFHHGLGRSSGVFFGGMMINYLGTREAFRIMAAIFFGAAMLYLVFIYLRSKSPKVIKGNETEVVNMEHSKNTDNNAG